MVLQQRCLLSILPRAGGGELTGAAILVVIASNSSKGD